MRKRCAATYGIFLFIISQCFSEISGADASFFYETFIKERDEIMECFDGGGKEEGKNELGGMEAV